MKKGLLKTVSTGLLIVLGTSLLVGCGGTKGSDEKVIRVGATPSPHVEILEQAKDALKEKGYTLEITEYNDYVIPNTAVNEGELDANFFQHAPYMNDFNDEKGTKLVSVANIHFEPLGIYSEKVKEVSDVKKGAIVAVPNDTTNEARALLLLEANGLIKLKEGAGIKATVNDIVDNPLELEIEEVEAAQLVRSLKDVDLAVINGNYVLSGGKKMEDAIAIEERDSLAADTYANIIAVKEGNEESEKIKALVEVLLSDEIRDYINENYDGAVVPVF